MWSRIYLIPLLQAEEDRDQVRRHYAERAREKALMGSETEVYNSGRYVSSLPDLSACAARVLCTTTGSVTASPIGSAWGDWLSALIC